MAVHVWADHDVAAADVDPKGDYENSIVGQVAPIAQDVFDITNIDPVEIDVPGGYCRPFHTKLAILEDDNVAVDANLDLIDTDLLCQLGVGDVLLVPQLS